MVRNYPLLLAFFFFLLPLSASAHIVSHTLNVSGMEANYDFDMGHNWITFTDDQLSCGGAAKYTVFYLSDPKTSLVVGSIDATGAVNIHNHPTVNQSFRGDPSYPLTNGIAYNLNVAYFTNAPSMNYSFVSGMQDVLPTACATEAVDTMTFNDPGLAPGTFLTLGAPTYGGSPYMDTPTVFIPYADDYGAEGYAGFIFEPADADPLKEGANGSLAGGFVIQDAFSPWDWAISSNPGTAFTSADYGLYTFAIVPQRSNCYLYGGTLATCTPDFLVSHTLLLDADAAPPAIATSSDIIAEATSGAGALVSYTTPAATDDIDGADSVDCAPASGGAFALGTTTVACTASDAAGNAATSTFAVVVRDTTPPVITLAGSSTMELPFGSAFFDPGSTANDAVDGSDPVMAADTVDVDTAGTYSIAYDSTDTAGNPAVEVVRSITVDSAPPTPPPPARPSAGVSANAGAGSIGIIMPSTPPPSAPAQIALASAPPAPVEPVLATPAVAAIQSAPLVPRVAVAPSSRAVPVAQSSGVQSAPSGGVHQADQLAAVATAPVVGIGRRWLWALCAFALLSLGSYAYTRYRGMR